MVVQRVYAKIDPKRSFNGPSARAKNRDTKKTDDTTSFKNSSRNSREATELAFLLFSRERAPVRPESTLQTPRQDQPESN
jgi:hypothetical protein